MTRGMRRDGRNRGTMSELGFVSSWALAELAFPARAWGLLTLTLVVSISDVPDETNLLLLEDATSLRLLDFDANHPLLLVEGSSLLHLANELALLLVEISGRSVLVALGVPSNPDLEAGLPTGRVDWKVFLLHLPVDHLLLLFLERQLPRTRGSYLLRTSQATHRRPGLERRKTSDREHDGVRVSGQAHRGSTVVCRVGDLLRHSRRW